MSTARSFTAAGSSAMAEGAMPAAAADVAATPTEPHRPPDQHGRQDEEGDLHGRSGAGLQREEGEGAAGVDDDGEVRVRLLEHSWIRGVCGGPVRERRRDWWCVCRPLR